jgi:tetratricopeptide (TPR) repeat protein
LLGQNFWEIFDVEYDLGRGAIRLFKTNNCSHTSLAYWLKSGQQYSEIDIEHATNFRPWTLGIGYLNGKKIRMVFDSGAETSLLSKQAAARAGIKLDSEGVQFMGYTHGTGRGVAKTYVARFSSFKIGEGEEIQNARLRIANVDFGFTDMLLGADFFLSHRIFVSNHEHKLFLSYSGGPVFDLSKHHDAAEAGEGDEAQTAANPTDAGQSSDASEVAREGSALVARGDFAAGLPLLSKAIAIDPKDPEYYYQRGNAYWAEKRADLALSDFDEVIKLNESFLPAYIPRAELQLAKQNSSAALADLNTVDRLAPKQADLRFSLALVYRRIDHMSEAIQQYDLWIENHSVDSRMMSALEGRCFSRAMQNQDLSAAMKDCDVALAGSDKSNSAYPNLWVDRALVRVRMGDYDKAISDCNDALKKSPKHAMALYVRAIAEARKNRKAESEADLAAARQLMPAVGQGLERYGYAISP